MLLGVTLAVMAVSGIARAQFIFGEEWIALPNLPHSLHKVAMATD